MRNESSLSTRSVSLCFTDRDAALKRAVTRGTIIRDGPSEDNCYSIQNPPSSKRSICNIRRIRSTHRRVCGAAVGGLPSPSTSRSGPK